MKKINTSKIDEERVLWWCPRCKEHKICPRGNCEAEPIGKIITKAVIDDNTVYDSKPWTSFESDEESIPTNNVKYIKNEIK